MEIRYSHIVSDNPAQFELYPKNIWPLTIRTINRIKSMARMRKIFGRILVKDRFFLNIVFSCIFVAYSLVLDLHAFNVSMFNSYMILIKIDFDFEEYKILLILII